MKQSILLLTVLSLALVSCQQKVDDTSQSQDVTVVSNKMAFFGGVLNDGERVSSSEIPAMLRSMNPGDSLDITVKGKINTVCQMNGCWMRVAAGDEEIMVRFKDYGFFVPKDAAGKETVFQGKAFIEETSVEDLQHYAKDAGKSEAEIAAITEPERTLRFTADAVGISQDDDAETSGD